MAFMNDYPYANLHELNLDWIIEKMEQLKVEKVTITETTDNDGFITTDIPVESAIYSITGPAGYIIWQTNDGTYHKLLFLDDNGNTASQQSVTVELTVHYEEAS